MAKKTAGRQPESQSVSSGIGASNGDVSGAAREQNPDLSTDEIAARAYEIYEREGRGDGRDMDHWLRAESELRAERQKNRSQTNPAPTLPRSARQHQESAGVQNT